MNHSQEPHRERYNGSKRSGSLLGLFVELVTTRLWLGLLMLSIVGLGLATLSFASFIQRLGLLPAFLLREIGAGILVGGVATALVRIFIVRYYDQFENEIQRFLREDVTRTLKKIQKEIDDQTRQLVDASASLEAMQQSGISRVYASRTSASREIALDLEYPGISQIRLIGISLNDFVRGDQPALHGAWKVIEQYIHGDRPLASPDHRLDIKALIIDPECLGARLRSHGESREHSAVAGRLKTDVLSTAGYLFELENRAREKCAETGVSFEFRLYRVPPILFLCRTDTVSYVQQYYFWASRYADVPIPVVRCRGVPELTRSHSLHREMGDHFDYIWQKASVSSRDFLEAQVVGVDKGLLQCGVVNVFNNPAEALSRMLWLLRHTRRRLYIQGISLHSFFDFGDLFAAIAQLVDHGNVDIKVLLLDPESGQAYYRSFREHLFVEPEVTFEEFRSDPTCHRNSRLYRDTQDTINNICTAIGPNANNRFQVRLYASAPACFLLIADDSVLVEQYHYGKILPEGYQGDFPVILGKDMPLVEYTRTPSDLVKVNPLRNPFRLMESHFDFAFDKCGRPLDLTRGLKALDPKPTQGGMSGPSAAGL